MNSADLCRRNGWKPGTVIEGRNNRVSHERWDRIVITAVGETNILGRLVATRWGKGEWENRASGEQEWALTSRDWQKVEEGEGVSEPEKDLTIEKAVKILSDNQHDDQTWKTWIRGSGSKWLTEFEAIAIAREYLRREKEVSQ